MTEQPVTPEQPDSTPEQRPVGEAGASLMGVASPAAPVTPVVEPVPAATVAAPAVPASQPEAGHTGERATPVDTAHPDTLSVRLRALVDELAERGL